MKLVNNRKSTDNNEVAREYLNYIKEVITYIYLFCMLGIFPLHYKNQYSKIGTVKYEFFQSASLIFIGVSLIFVIAKVILYRVSREEKTKINLRYIKEGLSIPDTGVIIYAVCVVISYLLSSYKDFGLKGAAGWEMGLYAQLIFVVLYFLISRNAEYGFFVLGIHLAASFVTYLLGILHRFEIDPLGMYEGLNLNQKVEFLSTIGQATWFSSYVCTGFAVGMTVFYLSKKEWIRVVTGIYTAVSFGILVTQNSDSAFIAIAGILLLLGYFSLSDLKKWCRFWEIVCMMWGTFAGIGILQRVFSGRAIPLDTLSTFFSQSVFTWVLLVMSLGILFFYRNMEKQGKDRIMKLTGKIYKGLLVLVAAAFVGMIVFIYLNTAGYLKEWFGFKSRNQYLLFNAQWGNYRGLTWMSVWKGFLEMSFLQKLFGVGPDSLAAYLYTIPEISQSLYDLWGGVKLTNAHNEFLNSLMCYGTIGLTSWIAVLVGSIRYFYGKAKENPFMIAFALCIVGYACHNIFCYQQVCCTPFLFIALGIGESLTKSEKFNTIK